MATPQWKFPPQIAGYMAQEPVQRELFTSEKQGSLARSLVREAVQNALDARNGNDQKPVTIRFGLVEVPADQYREYIEGLLPHLKAIDGNAVAIPDLRKPMRFLVIEDFNTKGLEGDPTIPFLKNPTPNQDFYYFWRNVGRTGKRGSSLGSWGLGKTVFPATSAISTFFGLTCRASDQRHLLTGQSVLRYHELKPGEPITPYGYFGVFSNQGNEQHFALPVDDERWLTHFSETFGLKRKPSESGLSLVVCAPDESVKLDQLLLQSLQEYFYPLLMGNLVVQVDGLYQERNIRFRVDRTNLIQTVEKIRPEMLASTTDFDKESFLRLLSFMDWSLVQPEADCIPIAPPNWKNAPQWGKYEIGVQMQEARERFETEHRLAFHIQVRVKLLGKKSDAQPGWFRVYLERDEQLQRYESYFLRSGIWVKDVEGHRLRGIRGVVVIDGVDNPLVHLLASAENPAHKIWQEEANGLKSYEGGVYTLRFVRQSLTRLAGMLTERDKEIDQNLLRDVFFLERPPERPTHLAKPEGANRRQPEGKPMGEFPDINGRAQPVLMQAIQDGVEIKNADGDTRVGVIEARFAYAIRRGNAFQNYDPLDFDLAQMPVEVQNAEIEYRALNMLRFVIRQPQFRVRVRGFDNLRDVEMRVTWKELNE